MHTAGVHVPSKAFSNQNAYAGSVNFADQVITNNLFAIICNL